MGTVDALQALVGNCQTRSACERIRGDVVANGADIAVGTGVASRTGDALRRAYAESALSTY